MTAPDAVVEFAFGVPANTSAASGDWVDESDSMISVTVKRGREDEFGTMQPGTASIRLYDPERRFDPSNAAGPYYGQLLPRVPVRVSADVSGTPRRFLGFVRRWGTGYDAGNFVGEVSVEAVDGSILLAKPRLHDPWPEAVETVVAATSAAGAWYTFGEPASSASVISRLTGSYDSVLTSPPAYESPSILPSGWGSSIDCADGASGHLGAALVSLLTGAGGKTIIFTIKATELPTATFGASIFTGYYDPNAAINDNEVYLELLISPDGYPQAWQGAGLGADILGAAVNVCDGEPHLVIITARTSSLYTETWIDGVQVASSNSSGAANSWTGGSGWSGGSVTFLGANPTFPTGFEAFTGRLDELIILNTSVTSAQADALYTAWTTTSAESPDEQIAAILDEIAWAWGSDLEPADGQLIPRVYDGQVAADYIATIVRTDGGRLFIARDGAVRFQSTAWIAGHTTPVLTFAASNDATSGDVVFDAVGFAPTLDDRYIVNRAVATLVSGEQRSTSDSDSIDTYGAIDAPEDLSGLLYVVPNLLQDRVDSIVSSRSEPRYRVPSLTIDLDEVSDTSLRDQVLALEIGDVVGIRHTPSRVGDANELTCTIEGVTETAHADDESWRITFTFAPADRYTRFTWDGDGATQGWDTGRWR